MNAKERLSRLLESGGCAVQEAGNGPFAYGTDGHTYAARTARALEREGRASLEWVPVEGRAAAWAWVHIATNPAPEGAAG